MQVNDYADSTAIRTGYAVAAGTLRVWAARGKVRTTRVGKRVLYHVDDVARHAPRTGILDRSRSAV